ncbi:MAG: M48 family metalloprotease [Planctomycetes bacterium]|nr:M48 family metalloprotease [Planctomycetota bacterium]
MSERARGWMSVMSRCGWTIAVIAAASCAAAPERAPAPAPEKPAVSDEYEDIGGLELYRGDEIVPPHVRPGRAGEQARDISPPSGGTAGAARAAAVPEGEGSPEDDDEALRMESFRGALEAKRGEGGSPRLSEEMFTLVDEEAIGAAALRAVLGKYPLLSPTAPVSRYVRLVGALLAEESSRPEIQYRFIVLDAETINAFAAPDGYVFVTRGLLGFLENEAELAWVIAHEIAHIERRDGIVAIAEGMLDFWKKTAAARADQLATLEGLPSPPGVQDLRREMDRLCDLAAAGRGRPQETESDLRALELASAVGYNPRAARSALERLSDLQGETAPDVLIFQSHPHTAERLGAIDRWLRGRAAGGVLNSRRFQETLGQAGR